MLLYRVSAPEYGGDLSSNGARLYGGRWNEKGVALVYLASSRVMAMMDLLVHLRPEDLQRQYAIAVFDVPEDKMLHIAVEDLPGDWKDPERKSYLHALTADFVHKGTHLTMQAPTVLVEEESNCLLNPLHSEGKVDFAAAFQF